MFKGSMVAMVTPMHTDGSIDKSALHALVDWHLASQTDGIIVAGTTGESATLEADEQFEIISLVVKQVAGRLPVIAGAGTSATKSTIALTQNAKQAGADAALLVTPYYNRPTQKGLYAHYQAITQEVDIPLILYNVPSRTACDLLPDTVARLAELSQIIGIKETIGKLERMHEIKKCCPPDFAIYSGDDPTALSWLLEGAQGVISVTANVAPQKMHALYLAVKNQEIEKAKAINQELLLLHQRLFIESNPIPTKWALHLMGKIQPGIRLPLVPLDNPFHHDVKEAMIHAGVL